MSTVTSVEELINQALTRIGFPEQIGNIYEGTRQARTALDVYGQTRDALMRASDWDFCETIAAAIPSGTAPPAIWAAEYTYPTDCLRLRNLYGADYVADRNNPMPIQWTIADDPARGKVIWTNVTGATLVYSAQVTDVTKWEPLFVEALVTEIAKRIAPLLQPEFLKAEMEEEKTIVPMAASVVG